MDNQKLFNYLKDEHGVTMLDSDMNEIERIVKGDEQYLKEANNWDGDKCPVCGSPAIIHQSDEGTGHMVSKYEQLKQAYEELLLSKLNDDIAYKLSPDIKEIKNFWLTKAGLK